MSLTEVIVGGTIGVAGSTRVALAGFARERRNADRVARVQLASAATMMVGYVRNWVDEGRGHLPEGTTVDMFGDSFVATSQAMATSYESLLAAGSRRTLKRATRLGEELDRLMELSSAPFRSTPSMPRCEPYMRRGPTFLRRVGGDGAAYGIRS